jgi:hypothetical protein
MDLFEKAESPAAAHEKPCLSCRKRKVKCNKTRPCSNCSRSKQLCTYESIDSSIVSAEVANGASTGDTDLRERLARLEKMMEEMMLAAPAAKAGSVDASQPRPPAPSSTLALPRSNNKYGSSVSSSSNSDSSPVGQIIFQELHSAYFDADFWPVAVCEVSTYIPLKLFRSLHPY